MVGITLKEAKQHSTPSRLAVTKLGDVRVANVQRQKSVSGEEMQYGDASAAKGREIASFALFNLILRWAFQAGTMRSILRENLSASAASICSCAEHEGNEYFTKWLDDDKDEGEFIKAHYLKMIRLR